MELDYRDIDTKIVEIENTLGELYECYIHRLEKLQGKTIEEKLETKQGKVLEKYIEAGLKLSHTDIEDIENYLGEILFIENPFEDKYNIQIKALKNNPFVNLSEPLRDDLREEDKEDYVIKEIPLKQQEKPKKKYRRRIVNNRFYFEEIC